MAKVKTFFAKNDPETDANFDLETKGFTFVHGVFLVNYKTIFYKTRSFQHFSQALNLEDNKIISTSKRVMAKLKRKTNVFIQREKIRPKA